MPKEIKKMKFYPEDVKSTNPRLLNYWLRNRLVYSLKNYVLKSNIHSLTEFDINLHKALTMNKLFCWNRFMVNAAKGLDFPVKALAIFAHDQPVPALHPLQIKVRDLWGKCISRDSENSNSYKNLVNTKILPRTLRESSKLIEFDQSFYQNLFENVTSSELAKLNKSICSTFYKYKETIGELQALNYDRGSGSEYYEDFSPVLDFYRFRLVAVVKDLDYNSNNEFQLKQLISSRYITVSALKIDDLYGIDEHGIQFQSLTFYGHAIPSPVKLT